ncbi:alpha/beta hydrolase [Kribbella speibonae]|uniref:Alpha/beta hydrolase n=1 Tax=Kribbella speibonae TaxID=1572660 RepID=A0A4R0J503_9ACTN|nr:alpha/beta hydrolase [Kribbella speibonae]TCC36385.1 alpha/beta hydrolase [Kribbella speibonae]
MPLDPVLAALIAGPPYAANSTRPVVLDVATARDDFENIARTMAPVDRRDSVAGVHDATAPGPAGPIPLRVYQPLSAAVPAPVIVWFHGGGWMIGSLDTGDIVARALCRGVGAVVVSVDYRLAPEHPWPAGLDDAAAALRWVAEHAEELCGDPVRIAVGGDSAGGNLAAVLAQQTRGGGPVLAGQILVYPATDLELDHFDNYPSWQLHASGYVLTADAVRSCVETYLQPAADVTDSRISPARCKDLTGLPPAVVAVAEFDPLRDQGAAYASALREADVPTVLHEGRGLVHGCFDMLGIVPVARTEFDQLVASVHMLFAPDPGGLVHPGTVGSS